MVYLVLALYILKHLVRQDYNVLFVDMALFTIIGLLAGVLLDISYGFIDPRIRMGGEKIMAEFKTFDEKRQ